LPLLGNLPDETYFVKGLTFVTNGFYYGIQMGMQPKLTTVSGSTPSEPVAREVDSLLPASETYVCKYDVPPENLDIIFLFEKLCEGLTEEESARVRADAPGQADLAKATYSNKPGAIPAFRIKPAAGMWLKNMRRQVEGIKERRPQ
jgi:hypothetical protein